MSFPTIYCIRIESTVISYTPDWQICRIAGDLYQGIPTEMNLYYCHCIVLYHSSVQPPDRICEIPTNLGLISFGILDEENFCGMSVQIFVTMRCHMDVAFEFWSPSMNPTQI